ncbi:zf-HC2 domain-containing protein [Ectothiorhodospiraceae bacterium WFHF3C12]|nr:zf-HC2 domain-containing protein [Ectothiorhodospiraceae bacterium WFHF3C12]
MNCTQAREVLEARLDGEVSGSAELDAHLAGCARCRALAEESDLLRRSLVNLPVQGPRPGFADDVLAQAVSGRRGRHRVWPWSAAAAGLVAGLALGVLLGGQYGPGSGAPHNSVQLVAGAGAQPVKLVFDAPQALSGVELTLRLEGAVEIDGYAGERTLSWRTDLDAGKNLLTLPMRPTGAGEGVVIARLRHDGMERTYRVRLNVLEGGPDGALAPQSGEVGDGHA